MTTRITAELFQGRSFFLMRAMGTISRQVLSGNLSLAPATPVSVFKHKKTWLVETTEPRPMILLFEYMNAKKKHIDMFLEFYNARQFDVVLVNLKPWQLFWPVQGSQVVAQEVAEFLLSNLRFFPIVYHGFSVGGYLWGEVLRLCLDSHPRYLGVTQRIRGQIVDSGVDVSEIPTAFPAAVFPSRPFLRCTFEKFIRYQMKTFYNESTRHYIAARAAFTHGLIHGPTLFIYSDSDPLSTKAINEAARQELLSKNLPVLMKEFHGSKHVMHFYKYKEEYLSEVSSFLDSLDFRLDGFQDSTSPSAQSKL